MKSIFLVFGFLSCIVSLFQATPDVHSDLEPHKKDIALAVKLGRWDTVEDILSETLINKVEQHNIAREAPLPFLRQNVRSLQPPNGAHVYGESKFEYTQTSNNGGHIQQSSGGHQVINSDGRVTEYKYRK